MSNDINPLATIIVLTAPSGAGKTTIARGAIKLLPHLRFSVSATTRPIRDYEVDGKDYHFVSRERFDELVATGAFLEYEEVYADRFYGTLWSEVEASSPSHPVLLDIDVLGAGRVKKKFGDQALAIFVAPPSLEVLKTRLVDRKTEDSESIDLRISRARMEISMADRFDHSVVNEDIDKAISETVGYVERFLTRRIQECAQKSD
ncbi:MAG: guanylate kinase [Rhodothermales bacterium]|nr:guanylate kinase [Rhodothermales bacterium]